MHHLLLSIDSIIDSRTGKPFTGIIRTLQDFKKADKENDVVVISARGTYLDQIPDDLNPTKVPFNLRGSGEKLVSYLETSLEKKLDDIIVIAAKDTDMFTARHLKAILLRADYAKNNNPKQHIYTRDYGIPLKAVSSITDFFESFNTVENPWYCKVKVDDDTDFLALTSANTFTDNGDSVRIKEEFREYLKNNKKDYVIPFVYYFIVAAHLMVKDLVDYDYWDIYPSSKKESINEDLLYFARKASHTFGKQFHQERLFIRVQDSMVRHKMSPADRIKDGCDDQFRTLIINPAYKNKLAGKNVCIIDDFSRHGTSCETVRLLLKEAGVNKILFIAMGKFKANANYNRYTYKIKGDVFSKFKYEQISHEVITGSLNPKANKDFIESLGKWI